MKVISNLVDKLQEYRQFRILVSKVYPTLVKFKIIRFLKKLNKGSYSDRWESTKEPGKYDLLFKKFTVDFNKLVLLKKNYTFGFLMNPNSIDLNNITNACNTIGVKYIIYDIKNPSLFMELRESPCDGIFIFPVCVNNIIRNLFHEAAQLLSSETKIMIYPSLRELNIYEAKRTLANFLTINNIPHPSTSVFYDYESTRSFLEKSTFPLVFKTHLGASSKGVEILKDKRQALKLAKQLFNKYYLRKMETEKRAREWGYMFLQEYIDEVKEYRITKIGDSWFGFQKWKTDDQIFMSGSGVKKWIDPSEDLLNFCYNLAAKYQFTTMCFDIFENKQGELMVNELQTSFGSYNPSQMYLEDGTPGRYLKLNDKWIFEAGLFNVHGSILLRLIHLISLLQKEK